MKTEEIDKIIKILVMFLLAIAVIFIIGWVIGSYLFEFFENPLLNLGVLAFFLIPALILWKLLR